MSDNKQSELKQENCKHQTVAFFTRTVKLIPEGFEEFNSDKNKNLNDYKIIEVKFRTTCDDCGKLLEINDY